MPEFAPGEVKTAIAPITVSPAGLSCQVEIFLGPDELTKVATSGLKAFISTGASQNVRLPIAMPAAEGSYHVYIDVYAEGLLVAAYKAIEDVVTAPAMGMITLYGTNFDVKGSWEWFATWYYPEGWRVNINDYYGHRGPNASCTPPEPIDLSNLRIKVSQGSYQYGWTSHGPFGPFVVEDGGIYTIDLRTGQLSAR